MKTLIFLPVLFFAILSCSKSDNNDINSTPSNLVGKWKLIERKISDGGSAEWVSVANGFVLTLNSNNTYMSTESSDCNVGSFSIQSGVIIYINSCGNTTIPNKFNIVSQTSKELILSNVNCIEECKDKFQKIE